MKSSQSALPQNDPAKAEQALVLPGYLFFVETIEIPNDLEASEIPDFAELSIESIAPFPIDQLHWGYLYRKDVPTLLLYAARRERLKNEGFADLNDYAWVVPDFATLSGARFYDDTLVLLESDNGVSLTYFEKNADIPKSVWLDRMDEPITESKIKSLRSSIRDLPQTASVLHLRPVVANVNENGIPTFEHTVAEQTSDRSYNNDWQPLPLPESQLWQMDVRDTDFKTAEKSKRRTSAVILRITGWAAIFALILLLAEGLLFAAQNWLQTQLDTIERQQVAVSKVEEKQILVNKLEQVAQNELRPIEMLEAANNIRLKLNLGIEYDEVIIEGENHITIEGKASSISALNRYADNLKNSGLFELLDKPDPSTRNGKTTFRVSLAYYPRLQPKENPTSFEDEDTTDVPTLKKEAKTG